MKIERIEISKGKNAFLYLSRDDRENLEICLPRERVNDETLKKLASDNGCFMQAAKGGRYDTGVNFIKTGTDMIVTSLNPNSGEGNYDIEFNEEYKRLAEIAVMHVYGESLGQATLDFLKRKNVVKL